MSIENLEHIFSDAAEQRKGKAVGASSVSRASLAYVILEEAEIHKAFGFRIWSPE